LQALLALLDVKLDALPLFQVPEAFALDRGIVDKDVIGTLPRYEPIALGSIEPLDSSSYSFRHFSPSFLVVRKKVQLVIIHQKHPDS
jgi:hypothetical protein